jgi:hypothetical protein
MRTRINRPWSLPAIVFLATVQGVLGFLRANHWFRMGADLLGQGFLIIPLTGIVAIGRGGLVAGMCLLYLSFSVGALLGKTWAWWTGLIAAVLNILLVVSILLQGESIIRSLVWIIVPVLLLCYLFSRNGIVLRKTATTLAQPR